MYSTALFGVSTCKKKKKTIKNLGLNIWEKILSETSISCEHYFYKKTKEAYQTMNTPCLTDYIWSNGGKTCEVDFFFLFFFLFAPELFI